MGRHSEGDLDESVAMREREPRPPLPPRSAVQASEDGSEDSGGMTHEQLVDALRAIDGLVDVSGDPPNFHFGARPFLHFHVNEEGTYADVRFESDFEPIWASTPREREVLLARVWEHVERGQSSRKPTRKRSARGR